MDTFGREIAIGDVVFAANGIGGQKYAQMVDKYRWIDVYLKPSKFLELANPLIKPRPSQRWIEQTILAGHSITPASLRIWLPQREGGVPSVVEHDGRHRMIFLKNVLDDREVPVTLFFDNMRVSKEVARQMVAEQVLSQNKKMLLSLV